MWLDSDVRFVSARLKIWPLEKKKQSNMYVQDPYSFINKTDRRKKKKETEKTGQSYALDSLANKTPKEA